MSNYIIRFDGEYRFLSNFYPYKSKEGEDSKPLYIMYDDIVYPSTEHAYQAAKTIDVEQRLAICGAENAYKAKKMGRQVTLRPDWEEVKVDVMRSLLIEKFRDAVLREKLNATQDAVLVEGNYWHDAVWGVCWCDKCMGVGQNMLGKLLMKIRDE